MPRALALVAIIAMIATAHAQPVKQRAPAGPPNITGIWAFETQPYANGCTMTGVMTIKPDARGQHACSFEALEKCPDMQVRAKETCQAKRNGADLKITSTVHQVKPDLSYDPDNFELTIRGGSYMKGMMRSFNSAPVEFFRGDAPIS
jgi:hypothetical protein